jgi:hypothetical protein
VAPCGVGDSHYRFKDSSTSILRVDYLLTLFILYLTLLLITKIIKMNGRKIFLFFLSNDAKTRLRFWPIFSHYSINRPERPRKITNNLNYDSRPPSLGQRNFRKAASVFRKGNCGGCILLTVGAHLPNYTAHS